MSGDARPDARRDGERPGRHVHPQGQVVRARAEEPGRGLIERLLAQGARVVRQRGSRVGRQ